MPAKKKASPKKGGEEGGEGGGDAFEATAAAAPAKAKSGGGGKTEDRIHVYLRVRPENKREISNKMEGIVRSDIRDPRVIHLTTQKTYGFDGVFYQDSNQPQVYNASAAPVLAHVFEGFQAAILAYGQTGSGKTHTMRGKDGDLAGIIPRLCKDICDRQKNDSSCTYEVTLSYIQLYLDKPRDLCNPKGAEPKIIVANDVLTIQGLSEHKCTSEKQMMHLIDNAEKYKVVRATCMNPESSRGHSCLIINVGVTPNDVADMRGKTNGRLFVVDLAGYEQAGLIGQGSPELVQETKHINETLLGLNRVMVALASRSKVIPYRESNLTLMLKDALGLKTRSVIMIMMSPALEYKQQTYNTLHFGKSAMAVEIKATVKAIKDWKKYAEMVQGKLDDANKTIMNLMGWLSKKHPKDIPKLEKVMGKIEIQSADLEGFLNEVAEATGSTADEPDEDIDDDDDMDAATDKIEKKFKKKAARDQKAFQAEMELLEQNQTEELEALIASGASPEAIQTLREEHALERKLLEDREKEHAEVVNEAYEGMKMGVLLRYAGKLKALSRKAKAIAAKRGQKKEEAEKKEAEGEVAADEGLPPASQFASNAEYESMMAAHYAPTISSYQEMNAAIGHPVTGQRFGNLPPGVYPTYPAANTEQFEIIEGMTASPPSTTTTTFAPNTTYVGSSAYPVVGSGSYPVVHRSVSPGPATVTYSTPSVTLPTSGSIGAPVSYSVGAPTTVSVGAPGLTPKPTVTTVTYSTPNTGSLGYPSAGTTAPVTYGITNTGSLGYPSAGTTAPVTFGTTMVTSSTQRSTSPIVLRTNRTVSGVGPLLTQTTPRVVVRQPMTSTVLNTSSGRLQYPVYTAR